MITVYVLESFADATWYTGMAKDVLRRLKEHNDGKNRFTKGHRPWKIIYTETHPSWGLRTTKRKISQNECWQKLAEKTFS